VKKFKYLISAFFFIALNSISAQVPTIINVEIDYMADATHSHKPSQTEIDAVIQMFACHGITLNVVVDDQIQHFDVLRRDPANNNNFFGYNNGTDTYGGIKAANFNNGAGWHYCVFAHQYQDKQYNTSGSSGLGEQPGDDFLVTLGSFSGSIGTDWDRASTFAHELGHNLNLSHSGDYNELVVGSNTPNLPSIMSYFYQLSGVRNNLECQGLVPAGLTLYKNLDYSNGRACPVDENALNEAFGIGIKSVDWNCDGTISGFVAQDISNNSSQNGWCGVSGSQSLLSDYDEWSHIVDVTGSLEKYVTKEVSCITYEEYIARPDAVCPQPTVVNENCTNNQMFYVSSSGNGFVEGSCNLPLANIGTANLIATDGDIIYLLPGNHSIGSVPLVISKRLIIGGSGNAIIGQ
jgi:hypothetical protein